MDQVAANYYEDLLSAPYDSAAFGRMDQELATARNARLSVVTPPVVKSRIRVLLSRPLTWAEKEWLETDHTDVHLRRIDGSDGLKINVAPNFEHVWVEADFGSRLSYELVAAVLETDFVNVFPKAVRTFREYNGE